MPAAPAESTFNLETLQYDVAKVITPFTEGSISIESVLTPFTTVQAMYVEQTIMDIIEKEISFDTEIKEKQSFGCFKYKTPCWDSYLFST